MRGVSMPTHEYARQAQMYLEPKSVNREDPSTPVGPDILSLALTTRAYTRVVLRLRAQAESEARFVARQRATAAAAAAERNQGSSTGSSRALPSRAASNSSRATSPSSSSHRSHSHTRHASNGVGETKSRAHYLSGCSSLVQHGSQFRSPLVKLHRAPLLRVFVPSPDGEWLSDASVLECEAELKRSGVIKLMRVGDVVWDAAVGDEGNLGRMVWDGSYLVDLDYKYSRIGELPAYFHSLAFTPSYFHRVIRTGVSAAHNPNGNPIVYVDVSPWGEELARNLQLLQDRSRTETPHGALHSVLRWVHRSSFTIRPPPPSTTTPTPTRVPIPNVEDGFFIDPGWYGTVVVEAEGTNEGLVDLQARCGPGAFPPRPETMVSRYVRGKEGEGRVWRVLRERSRPGEIWLRAVREKERVM
ncbi:hypothetical protein F5I97DRAFT_1798768 [Phlebopus sp. FC_14]|nr:hypothetical protein F5I97DRAFT_1798768 [Phlebopus sp. FC_14]